MMPDAPDFSGVAESYSASRPGYPSELYEWLASIVPRRELAWDVATGNGQAAVDLATHFDRVIASDSSAAQIRHAKEHPRVEYRVAPAEASGLPADSVDLVVAASALHWFDLPRFYEEARRVTRSAGVLAAWTYHVGHVEPPFDVVFGPFYRDVVSSYFAAGARLVDDRYGAIELPGRRLEAPEFTVSASWNLTQILDFVRTWSGVQSYMEATGEDPVASLAPQIERVCGSRDAVHQLRWPVYMRASVLG
jgi:SAM-dependent methyltransferase